jgi:general L-amino acid transport system substrate-binding protein
MRNVIVLLAAALSVGLWGVAASAQIPNTVAPAQVPNAGAPAEVPNTVAPAQVPNTAPPAPTATAAPPAPILEVVRAAKHLACGVVKPADDWDLSNLHGDLSDLGADICRSVSIAILGSTDGMILRRYPGELEALVALKAGQIALATTISPDTTVATQFGVAFGPPVYFDTQRFLVHRNAVKTLADLKNRLVCVIKLSDPERTLHDELSARGIAYGMIEETEQGEMDAAIAVSHCAGTGLESRLAQSRQEFHARIADFDFLPERFGLQPVVPAYHYGDQKFDLIVKWTIYALIEAEALGVTQGNVVDATKRQDIRAIRLLGGDPAIAQALGLESDWATKVIAGVGNYGEIFAHTVGDPYQLDRGLNRLWTQGGLMRPLPMQ